MPTHQPLLIDVEECLSPKLKFLIKHGLSTKNTSKSRWNCKLSVPPKKGAGRTEEDAIIDWCVKNKVTHYNLE